MITRRVVPVGLFALLLGACSTIGRPGLIASSSRVELSPAAASAIADDMVSRLAEHVGPASGTIVIKSEGSPFGQALEAALRGWGYAIATDQQPDQKAIALAYVVDNLDGTILARLSTPKFDLGRAYAVTASGAKPTSPVSVMQRG